MSKESTDVSQRIRARLKAKQQRFHANDNISAFIEPGELDELTKEVCEKMTGVLESLVIDIEQRSQHPGNRAARRQDVRERGVPRPLRAAAQGHRVPQRRAPERAHDHGADHGAQRLQPSPLSHHGTAVDRRDAQQGFRSHRAVQVLAHLRVDHVAAADPGRGHHPAGRPAGRDGEARTASRW